MSPHTGIEVGHQLQAHAILVSIGLIGSLHLAVCLIKGTHQILDVVSHLMGDDIGLGEAGVVTLYTELSIHRLEESQIQIHLLVTRAIERSHGCLTLAAGGLSGTRVKNQCGCGVLADAILLENLCPYILSASYHLAGKYSEFLFLGSCLMAVFGLDAHAASLLQHVSEVTPHQQGNQSGNNQSTDTAQANLGACAHSTAIFNIFAFASSFKSHNDKCILIVIVLSKSANIGIFLIIHQFID